MRQSTVFAVEAGVGDPFDPDAIADLDVLGRTLSESDDDSGSFVSADEGQFGWEGPVALKCVQVRVADSREEDLYDNKVKLWVSLRCHDSNSDSELICQSKLDHNPAA